MRSLLLFIFFPIVLFGQAPTANFNATNTTVCLGQPVQFNNTSTNGASPINNWSWDFGDGSSSNAVNPQHVYAAPGTYTVTLVVQTTNGQADAELKTNYITINPSPTASYTAATNGCSLPVAVTFSNTSTGASTYAWSFGNGQTSTLQNPAVVTYPTAGTYDVSLITTNSFGCKDTVNQSIVVSNFQAGITVPTSVCVNTPVLIEDNSTIGANAWSWTFTGANPGSSTAQDNSITYSSPGTYTINLTSQNTTSGCSGSASATVTVNPLPVPSFTATPTTGCAPLPVTFTNTSGSGTNFVWDFGDGSTFNGQNPGTHTYTQNGNFTVTLSMTNPTTGCVGTIVVPTITMNAPNAQFTSNVINGCDPVSVTFSDNSTSPDPITNWFWMFGDGTTFVGQNPPPHTYPVGMYDVSLVIQSQSGCIDTVTVQDYVQVGHIDLVNFSIDETPQCAKTPIDFTNLSIINAPHLPNEVTYAWDFGDGGSSTQENPSYSYASDTGFFDVSLIVTFRGCKDTLTLSDAVYIKPPISFFTPDITLFCNQGPNGHVVTVNDQSKINSIIPPQDALVTWHWGDGTPNTVMDDPQFDDLNLSTTTHTYNGFGTYTIKQVIQNFTTGCSDSTTATIHVSETNITAMTSVNDSVCRNSPLTFGSTVLVNASYHTPVTYAWNMGDGGSASGQAPTYTYTTAGTYSVQLTATNAVGCSDVQTLSPIRVLELPNAAMTPNDNAGCAPFTVVFTNNSSVQGNGVPLSSFAWSFPAPNQTTTTTNVNQTVTHTFNTEGVFNPTIIATDVFGCVSAPGTTTITVTKPVAAFTLDAVVCENENFVASNGSTGVAPLSYQWFVDGSPLSTSQDVPNSHNEPNNNVVSSYSHNYVLITTDANGCKDTATNVLTVSTPVAIIDYVLDGAATNANGDFLCPPVFADFTDGSLSFGNVSSYSWVFGDGKTSSLPSPNNTYVFPGTYSVGLTITDEFGCTSDTTLQDYLTIFGPTATPSWIQSQDICGQDVVFDIGDTSNVTSIVWTMDDGNVVNDSTLFTYTYGDVTVYNPSVAVYDDNGCEVIYPLDPITIPDNGLNAQFSIGPNPTELGQLVQFVDQSSSNAPIVSWTWDLGNIDPFTANNGNTVSNYYVQPGAVPITLLIVDQNGCTDEFSLTLNVEGTFTMPNVVTPNGDGINDVFSFPYPIFTSYDILILNRWGSVVRKANNVNSLIFWDGKDEGEKPVNDGVYFYTIQGTLTDGSSFAKDGYLEVFH